METRSEHTSAATAPEMNPVNAATTAGQPEREVMTGMSFAQIFQGSALAPASSAACRKYAEDLIKSAERLGLSTEAVITGTVDAQVVYNRAARYGVALIFAGSTGIAKRPVSDRASEVIAAFHQHSGCDNIRILKSFVIDESSYDYANQTVVAIHNMIATVVAEDEGTINVASFRINNRDVPLVVCTKPDVYKDYVRRVSPFGFSERDDIGFTVGVPRDNCPVSERFNVSPETHMIFFAVTGYTQFVRIENPQWVYGQQPKSVRPLIHIASIVSQIPSIVLLPPAITIATKVFIAHRNWRRPYLMINGKESANVGNLVISQDPATGARSTSDCETPFQAEEALNQACEEPILCLDITDGRDGIPGTEIILAQRDSSGMDLKLSAVLARFYGDRVIPEAHGINFIAGAPIKEYTGSVMIDNTVMDSRCADYLRMFRKIGDYSAVAGLLNQPNDPALRLQQLQDLQLTTKSLYNTNSVIFTRDAIQFFADLCPNFDVDLTNDTRFNYAFSNIEAAAGLAGVSYRTAGGPQGGNFYGGTPYGRW